MSDLQGKHLYRNTAYYTSLGFEVDEDVDLDGYTRVHPDDLGRMQVILDRLKREGTATNEYRVRHKNGHWICRQAKIVTLYDERHQPEAFLSIIRDITHRKLAEEKLRESEERYRQLLEFSPVGITVHADGKVVFTNPAGAAIIGAKNPAEMVGKPITKIILSNLGLVAQLTGDYVLARALYEESLAIRRALGDKSGIAVALNNLGYMALDLNALTDAQAWLEEAVTIQRTIGDKQLLGNALNNLGNVRRAQGEYSHGVPLYLESLRIMYELGDQWALAYLLEDMGSLASLRNQAELALWLVGAASAIRDKIGAALTDTEKNKLESLLTPARQALGEAASEAALTSGRNTPLEQVIEKALDMQYS